MDQNINTIELLIKAISEDLSLKILAKEVNRQEDIFTRLPKTFKGQDAFYLSVFYNNKTIRSRTVSNCHKDNDKFSKTESRMHQKIYANHLLNMKQESVAVQDGFMGAEKPYMLIRVGHVVFIVSSSNSIVVEIFSFILSTFFVYLKALFEVSESGHLCNLENSASNYRHGLSYIKRVKDSAEGRYRGHM